MTVKMYRGDGDDAQTADVHPDEVSNYQEGGWLLSESVPVVKAEPSIADAVLDAVETMPKPARKPRSKADAHK